MMQKSFSAITVTRLTRSYSLLPSTTGHKSAVAAPGVAEHGVSQSSRTDAVKRGFTVRQLFHLSLH